MAGEKNIFIRLFSKFKLFERPNAWPTWRIFLFSLLLGLLAGLGASFLVWGALGPIGVDIGSLIIQASNNQLQLASRIDYRTKNSMISKAVIIYRNNSDKADQLSLGDPLVGGAPMTSDGWVATIKPSGPLAKIGVVWKGVFYPSEKTIEDTFTGAFFIKIKAQGLPLAPFSQIGDISAGDDLISYDGKGTLYPSRLLNNHLAATAGIHSSESLDALMQVQNVPAGLPLFNSKGELAGLAKNNGWMIPSNYLQQALKNILKDGKTHRPLLGINYLDLSTVIAPVGGGMASGALVKAGKDGRAIIAGSPAAKAGLKEGDIIVSVDNFELNENQTLAEVVANYTPGTKIVLDILRNGKEMKLNVTLSEK